MDLKRAPKWMCSFIFGCGVACSKSQSHCQALERRWDEKIFQQFCVYRTSTPIGMCILLSLCSLSLNLLRLLFHSGWNCLRTEISLLCLSFSIRDWASVESGAVAVLMGASLQIANFQVDCVEVRMSRHSTQTNFDFSVGNSVVVVCCCLFFEFKLKNFPYSGNISDAIS